MRLLHTPLCHYHRSSFGPSLCMRGHNDLPKTRESSAPQTLESKAGDHVRGEASESPAHETPQLH